MDSKHIEQLLEKYWSCETSLEEEKELREFFAGNAVPDALKETAALFQFFESERKRTVGQDFDKNVTRQIKKQHSGKLISMVNMVRFARIAAGVLVVVAATYFIREEVRKSYPDDSEISDPKIALEETKKALMMISKSFGKARKEAGKMNIFNEAEKKIQGKKENTKEKINI